jgi:hypothetical protein
MGGLLTRDERRIMTENRPTGTPAPGFTPEFIGGFSDARMEHYHYEDITMKTVNASLGAYFALGIIYAQAGDRASALQQLMTLKRLNEQLANELQQELYK